MTTNSAWRVHVQSTPAQWDSYALPELATGEVRVRIRYSSLNYKDGLAVTGKGRIMRTLPCVAGIDLAGEVETSTDDRHKPGDRVLVTGCGVGELYNGGLAHYAQLPGNFLIPVPDDVDLRDTMIYGTAGFTAALARYRMEHNDQTPDLGPIAVSGATGGVGSFAIALLAKGGYEVAAVTSKVDSAADYLRGMGATSIVDARTLEAPKAPLMKAQWGGAVDNVGGDLLSHLIAATSPWGNVASIGLAGSHKCNTTVMPFILRGVSLLGIHSVDTPRGLREAIWGKLFGEWRLDDLDRFVADEISLAQVPEACARLMEGTVTGRYVVRVD